RVEFQPPFVLTYVDVDSHLGQSRARGLTGGQYPSHDTTAAKILGAECRGDAMRDAQEDISVSERRFCFKRSTGPPVRTADGAREASYQFSIPQRFPRRGSFITRRARERTSGTGGRRMEEDRSAPPARFPKCLN
ncbi:hypothetical protein HAX54_039434, partial [Datura stramonium]|nr:hypothetical protein [Datura stramonium]